MKRINQFRLKKLFLLICLLFSQVLLAQDKYEKESRVKRSEVPDLAFTFIDSLGIKSKIKWYKEQSLSGSSYEAKFKQGALVHSVEFDTLGSIEDVEIEVKVDKIAPKAYDGITKTFGSECTGYSIRKVQQQYTGSRDELFTIIKNENAKTTCNYELVVKCKHEGGVDLFEYLFDSKGELISKSRIVFKNSSHLEY